MEEALRNPYILQCIVKAVSGPWGNDHDVAQMALVCKSWADAVIANDKYVDLDLSLWYAMRNDTPDCLRYLLDKVDPACLPAVIRSNLHDYGRRGRFINIIWNRYEQVRTPRSDLDLIISVFPDRATILTKFLIDKNLKWPAGSIVQLRKHDDSISHPQLQKILMKILLAGAVSYTHKDYEQYIELEDYRTLKRLDSARYSKTWTWDECPQTISKCDNVQCLEYIKMAHPPSKTTLVMIAEMVSARENVPERTIDFYKYAIQHADDRAQATDADVDSRVYYTPDPEESERPGKIRKIQDN